MSPKGRPAIAPRGIRSTFSFPQLNYTHLVGVGPDNSRENLDLYRPMKFLGVERLLVSPKRPLNFFESLQ
jgi:hypothetical protein